MHKKVEIIRTLYQSIDKFKLIKGGIKFGVDLALTGGIGSVANLTMKSVIKESKKVLVENEISGGKGCFPG